MRTLTLLLLTVGLLAGCRGEISDAPPIHINPNMDHQPRFDPQEAIDTDIFADGRAMRPLVPGTVARGFLREDTGFYLGRTEAGDLVAQMPVPLTRELVDRGQERYGVYCTMCHGDAGDGQGIIMVGNGGDGYGYPPATSYHTDYLRSQPDGHIYDVITNGYNNMPGYGKQIPVADRWAIVAYVRALQRSQNASADDFGVAPTGTPGGN